MTPADLVSIVSFDISLGGTGFPSSDKKLPVGGGFWERVAGNEGTGQEAGTSGSSEGTPDVCRLVCGRRYGLQRLQHGSATAGWPRSPGIVRHRSEEVDSVLQQRMTKTGVEIKRSSRGGERRSALHVSIHAVDSRGLQRCRRAVSRVRRVCAEFPPTAARGAKTIWTRTSPARRRW